MSAIAIDDSQCCGFNIMVAYTVVSQCNYALMRPNWASFEFLFRSARGVSS
jgi:hypothetical protein